MRDLGDSGILRNLFMYTTNRNEHVKMQAR